MSNQTASSSAVVGKSLLGAVVFYLTVAVINSFDSAHCRLARRDAGKVLLGVWLLVSLGPTLRHLSGELEACPSSECAAGKEAVAAAIVCADTAIVWANLLLTFIGMMQDSVRNVLRGAMG